MIQLNQRSRTPLYEQIYTQFQHGIQTGIYPANSKLPSIRGLAEQLHCSRNTIEAAYRLLMQEGYIRSHPGSGFEVESKEINPLLYEPEHQGLESIKPAEQLEDKLDNLVAARYDFTYGNLQTGTFPALVWKSITDDILLGPDSSKADSYTDSEGEWRLRKEIARQLAASRNISCSPEQVIVQGGTQASIQNLCALFDPVTDVIAMEEPGYDGARSAFEREHFRIHPCPVWDSAETFLASIHASHARLAYITPSNQFPLGLVMEREVRRRILDWAYENDSFVLEDDYCYEFNYRNQPLPSLCSLDDRGRVIYMGTFSKSLSPALRMNYLVLPRGMLNVWRTVFYNSYPAVSWLAQAVLSRYLNDSTRERHLRRIQVRSRKKYETLTAALRKHMGDRIDIIEGGAGLHLLVNVRDGRSQGELIALAREKGVRVYDTDRYWMSEDHPYKSCVLVGFSAIEEAAIEPGIETLSHAWFGVS